MALAWNDSISFQGSSGSSIDSDNFILMPANIFHALNAGCSLNRSRSAPTQHSLSIVICVTNAGMQFSMIDHGDVIFSLVINDFIPVIQINSSYPGPSCL